MNLTRIKHTFAIVATMMLASMTQPVSAAPLPFAQAPLFTETPVPPLNMLVMGRDHKLWYEAYNDASDLNSDGQLDVGYKPDTIDYFGYFDSERCYSYNGTSFQPQSVSESKKCSGSWSGDFLNYVTTSRIDALRKVLYGGKRSTDTNGTTILERAFIPQDAHSWGKEYQSVARDGYDISEYTPLNAPAAGKYILFANTSTGDGTEPLMRVMTNSPFRVWNWLSIERPVAGDGCFNDSNTRVNCVGTSNQPFPGHPGDHAAFQTMVNTYAVAANLLGSSTPATVDCGSNCNPSGQQDNFLTVIDGRIRIRNTAAAATYEFSIEGDDAVELTIGDMAAPTARAGHWGAHGMNACGTHSTGPVSLVNGSYDFTVWHEEEGGGEGFRICWRKTSGANQFGWQTMPADSTTNNNGGVRNASLNTYNLTPPVPNAAARTDYVVRVGVCASDALKEENCRLYPNGNLKPTGLLHNYGEEDRMYFGLLSGSYFNNTEGGVLRRNVVSFKPELDLDTGIFTAVNGIVKTLDSLRIMGFRYSGDYQYSADSTNCPALGTRAVANGECTPWGNPTAEMMYETMRYFAGAGAATPRYATGGSTYGTAYETTLGLPTATWFDPYATGRYPSCAKPYQTVISDINPSYDTGLPGNPFSAATPNGTTPTNLASFDANTIGGTIWTQEFGAGARNVFIGDVNNVTDAAPTVKSASSFGNIRGLAPEEPSKQGGFYAASVANFGLLNDIHTVAGPQKLTTYSVALASPLPRIEFPVNGRTITMVPFAKTVGGAFGASATAAFQPTNTIVDFYVEKILNLPGQATDATVNGGRPYAVFRINYEDVEQGNDHDMDAIVRYEIALNADNTLAVNLSSDYAAGGAIQFMGYVISGTTADGVYLEVRDRDTAAASAPTYKFNTPTGRNAGYCNVATPPADCVGLPLSQARTFTAGSADGAELLRDPLYYAAKFGGFKEGDGGNGIPEGVEWDGNNNGLPDNYFLVTNALGLKAQLESAFDAILGDAQDAGSLTISGVRIDANALSYVPGFTPKDWTGDLQAFALNPDATLGANKWSASAEMPAAADRKIFVVTTPGNSTDLDAAAFTVAGLGGSTNALAALGLTAQNLVDNFGSLTVDAVVSYLRGDATNEKVNNGPFRTRSSKVGDIVNSLPILTGPRDDYGYSSFAGPGGGSAYTSFVAGKSTQTPVVYVGANDGMLHAFDAREDGGNEIFAVIPAKARERMGKLARPGYTHEYFVDGKINIGDVYGGSSWRTVLVSSMGVGGASVFGLDVSNPNGFDADDVLWELTGTADSDVGVNIGRPIITVLPGNRWVAIFGNGYNSTNQDAVLMIVDANTGEVLKRIKAGDGTDADPNGFGNIVAGDINQDGYADVVYAGDYKGNLYKFDVSSTSIASWAVANAGAPLFTATGPNNEVQRITGNLEITRGPSNSVLVYFGTGRYFLDGDNEVGATPPIDTFYAVQDNGTVVTGNRSALQRQTLTITMTGTTETARTVSQNAVNYETQRGWYLDFGGVSGTTTTGYGERFFGEPLVVAGQILFISFQPIGNRCAPGGINRLYFLDSTTGARNGAGDNPCVAAGSCVLGDPDSPAQPPTTRPPVVIPQSQCIPGLDPDCAPPDPVTDPTACNPALGNCELTTGRCRLAAVNLAGAPIVLPRPCGRQSWRQLR